MATAAATKRAARPRTVAPKATTQAEVPATNNKPSIWTRVKTAAKKTAAVVAKPFKAVAAKIKPASKKAATTIAKPFKAVATKVKPTMQRIASVVVPFAKRFWTRALKPLLIGVAGGLALFGLVVGSLVAPLATTIALLIAGSLVILLALGVKRLEETETVSRLSRFVLRVLDIVATLGIGLVYATSALITLALCAGSWPFALFVGAFLGLAYFQVRGAGSIAFMTWALATGNLGLALLWALLFVMRMPTREPVAYDVTVPEYSEIRRKPEVHEDVVRAQPQARPTGSFLRAKGTEELWGTEWDKAPAADEPNWADVWVNDQPCVACGTDKGAMRVSTDGPVATHGLCTDCFDKQCEEDALKFTGVSLKARSVEVRLNQAGIEQAPQHAASKFDPTAVHWMESAWWRDRGGDEYPREKIALMDGREVARVVHDYKRKVYRASVLGQLVRNGVKTSWALAQHVAEDELMDEQAAVRRHEEAADEVVGEAPARLTPKKA